MSTQSLFAHVRLLIIASLVLVFYSELVVGRIRADEPSKDDVVAEIQKLGGKVVNGHELPPNTIIYVQLHGKVPDELISNLKVFPELQNLGFEECEVNADALKKLKTLPKLLRLHFERTDLSAADKTTFQGLPRLQQLTFGNKSKITDDVLAGIEESKDLDALTVWGSVITDAGLEHIAGLTNLSTLYMNTRATNEGMKSIAGLTKIGYLNLSSKATDDGLKQLSGLVRLRQLILPSPNITGTGLDHLKSLPKLENVCLGSGVTDAGFQHIGSLTHLRSLDISVTQVSDDGIGAVKDLPNLESLNISSTKLTDASIPNWPFSSTFIT